MGVAARTVASCGALACVCATSTLRGAPTIQSQATAVTFTDVTRESGVSFHHINGASPDKYLVETMGSGGLFFDFDDDGWLDLFLVDGGRLPTSVSPVRRHRLYRNRGNGTFEDVTAARASRIASTEWARARATTTMTAASTSTSPTSDRTSCIATTVADVHRRHAMTPAAARRSGARVARSSTSIATATSISSSTNYVDAVNNNPFCGNAQRRAGLLPSADLPALPNALYRNDGDGTFTDISKARRHRRSRQRPWRRCRDFDDDGRPDVFVANDALPNFLFHNDGDGTFHGGRRCRRRGRGRDGKAKGWHGDRVRRLRRRRTARSDRDQPRVEMHSLFRNVGEGSSRMRHRERRRASHSSVCRFWRRVLRLRQRRAISTSRSPTATSWPMSVPSRRRTLNAICCLRNSDGRFTMWTSERSGIRDRDGEPGAGRWRHRQRRRPRSAGHEQRRAARPAAKRGRSSFGQCAADTAARSREQPGRDRGQIVTATVGSRRQVREVQAGSSYLGQNDVRMHFGLGRAPAVPTASTSDGRAGGLRP